MVVNGCYLSLDDIEQACSQRYGGEAAERQRERETEREIREKGLRRIRREVRGGDEKGEECLKGKRYYERVVHYTYNIMKRYIPPN